MRIKWTISNVAKTASSRRGLFRNESKLRLEKWPNKN